ncbi:pyridoxamine 5'-phosphate oxidase family protein [Rummeliibacillus sp. JY-2-4R]
MLLLTVNEEGYPHNAMVSVGEVVALNRHQLRIGLWPSTSTTANILRSKKATLVIVYAGQAHYIRLSINPIGILPNAEYQRERFEAEVIWIRSDMAKYADIISGIQISLKDSQEVLHRWKKTIEEILQ